MSGRPSRGGFVLVGGNSSRMGRDKALLAFEGATLAESIAKKVELAARNVTLIGPPERYRSLGFRVTPDRIAGAGPLAGVLTALEETSAPWNLIVACDMPDVTVALFESLFHTAETSEADCVVAGFEGRIHPLCAVYRQSVAGAALHAIRNRSFRMHDFVSSLSHLVWPVADPALVANMNTPAEWSAR
jgi:molybdenum cofactor guanylyltransferase